jgi:hypothetical protein
MNTQFSIPPTNKLPTKCSFAPYYKVTRMTAQTQTNRQYNIWAKFSSLGTDRNQNDTVCSFLFCVSLISPRATYERPQRPQGADPLSTINAVHQIWSSYDGVSGRHTVPKCVNAIMSAFFFHNFIRRFVFLSEKTIEAIKQFEPRKLHELALLWPSYFLLIRRMEGVWRDV